jgi:hypothetical protein
MANLPADLHKLLEWLDRVSSLLEAQIVAAGLNHTASVGTITRRAVTRLVLAVTELPNVPGDVRDRAAVIYAADDSTNSSGWLPKSNIVVGALLNLAMVDGLPFGCVNAHIREAASRSVF